MTTTFTLETSKKIWEIVGKYDTEKYWHQGYTNRSEKTNFESLPTGKWYVHLAKSDLPAPTFQEVLRILPKIGDGRDWKWVEFNSWRDHALEMVERYINAPTEEQGTRDAEAYLRSLLTPNSSKERV